MEQPGMEAHDGAWVIKNTFLEFDDLSSKHEGMKRSNSASELSTYSSIASVQELKDWSNSNKGSRAGSGANSGCSTPRMEDVGEDVEECKNFKGQPPSLQAEELYRKLVALGGTRSVSTEMMAEGPAAQDVEEIMKHVPKDSNNASTSIGSIMHFKVEVGTHCKPCIFWAKGRCGKGDLCLHCHFKHPNVQSKRLRASKATRERRAKLLGQIKNCDDETLAYGGSSKGSDRSRCSTPMSQSSGYESSNSYDDNSLRSVGSHEPVVNASPKKEFKVNTIISL